MMIDMSGAIMCTRQRHSVKGMLELQAHGQLRRLLMDNSQSRLHIPACCGDAQARSSMDSTKRTIRGLKYGTRLEYKSL